MKILNIPDLLEVAGDELDPETFEWIESMYCSLTDLLAGIIAVKLNVELADKASNQPGFGGLCVGFAEGPNGERPDCIGDKDEGGEWK